MSDAETMSGNLRAAIEHSQDIAKLLDTLLNGSTKNVGFALLFFPLDTIDGTLVNYVSNCERGSMAVALKEVLARWQGQPEMSGRT